MNQPKLIILAADPDAACDPETGTCLVPQTRTGAAAATGAVLPGVGDSPSA